MLLLLASVFWLVTSSDAQAQPRAVDFAHDVVPIFRTHCVACHGGATAKGDLSINTRERLLQAKVIVPGQAAESALLRRVTSHDPEAQMPPRDRRRLSADEIDILTRWINEDARWEAGFTFGEVRYESALKPRRPELPSAMNGRTHPVDRIVDQYLREHQLSSPQPLDDAAFLHRVSLDLIGLLPTPEQRAAFLADSSPSKRVELIDQLLADQENYAEHWLTFWNDLLRNAYSGTGFIDDGRSQITGWLYASLIKNKPLDEFVRELIAPNDASKGFINGIKWRGNVNASQIREVQFAQSITQTFLGINMKCASCHDSFIDRWKLDQTYGLAAVFATQPLEIHRCDVPTGRMAQPAWIFPELGTIDAAAAQPERLKQLAGLMTHPENGRLTRTMVNRLWHRLMGRGIVHPVDAMHTPPWSADLLDHLGVALADNSYDLKSILKLIATSQAYQSQAIAQAGDAAGAEYYFRGPLRKRLTAEQILDAISQVTGNWPAADGIAFHLDGRKQGGQLAAVLAALQPDKIPAPAAGRRGGGRGANQDAALIALWGERHLRATLTPLDSLQSTLGRPSREQIVSSRPEAFTTLEALHLTNGKEMAALMQQGAQKLLASRPLPPEELARWLYQSILTRDPDAEELKTALAVLNGESKQEGLEDLLWSMFLHPEFQFVK